MSATLDVKRSNVLIFGTLNVFGNLNCANVQFTDVTYSNVEYQNVSYSNIMIANTLTLETLTGNVGTMNTFTLTNNFTILQTCNVVIRTDVNVIGNITSLNITSNALRISNLETFVTSNVLRIDNLESNVSNLQTFMTSNVLRIDNLETFVTSNVLRISNLESNVSNLQTFMTSNALRISNLETFVTSNVLRIDNLESNVSNLQTFVTSNVLRIDNLERTIQANTIIQNTSSNTLTPILVNTTYRIDANLVTRHAIVANLIGGTHTIQVSNLTNGKEVYVYVRNSNTQTGTRIINPQVSPTNTGFSNVFFTLGNTLTVSNTVTLPLTGLAGATIWVANINSQNVGFIN